MFVLSKENLLERGNEDLLEDLTGYPLKRIKQDKSRRFRKELEEKLEEKLKMLKRIGYLKEDGTFSEKSIKVYTSKIIGNIEKEIAGLFEKGEFLSKFFGEDEEWFNKKFGIGDKYYEINPKLSVRESIKKRKPCFIVTKYRERKGGHYIILLDCSGSMYGEKYFEACKALTVLLHKIIEEGNKVSLILYNDKIVLKYYEVKNITDVLAKIFRIVPNGCTDIALALTETLNLLEDEGKKHIILITDALPTYGEKPVENTLEAVKMIKNKGATISIIGIKLNKEGEEIARKIVQISEGNLFIVKELGDITKFVLIDYYLMKL